MENFVLNEKTKAGECDARRCKAAPSKVFPNGTKLCERHIKGLTEADLLELDADKPADVSIIPQKTDIDAYITPILEDTEEYIEGFEALEIRDDAKAAAAASVLKEIHDKIKSLETKRKEAVGPMHKAVKTVNGWFKPAVGTLEKAKDILKEKILEWEHIKERERTVALATGDTARAMALTTEAPKEASIRKAWTFEVTDLGEVPVELIQVNEAAVKALIRDYDPETLNIPGLRFFQKDTVVVGR